MKKNLKSFSVLVVMGMLVMAMLYQVPTVKGSISDSNSFFYIAFDRDNNDDDDTFVIIHNGWPDSPNPGEELFRIQGDGKVGIGTQEPTEKLDVNGTVRIRELPQDDTLENIVVADGNGVLHIRDVDTFGGGGDDNDWHDITTDSQPTDINADIYTNGDVGIGTDTPVTTLDVNGGFATNIVTVSSHYTTTGSDYTVLVDASSQNVRISLPPALDVPGQILVIKRIDTNMLNKILIDPDDFETIDGRLVLRLNSRYQSYTIQSDGYNWYIIAFYRHMFRSEYVNNDNR